MAGFDNETVYAANMDFTGSSTVTQTMLTNGQFPIAHTALNAGGTHIDIGVITSPLGTLSIGYSNPNITIDLVGGATAIEKVNVQTGTTPIVPTAGAITFNGAVVAAGTNPVRTDGTGVSTVALEVQISQALAAADATKIGLSNFNSTYFTVAATGFVSLVASAGTMTWTDVTSATQALSVFNGYFTDRGGGVTYTLPATAALGDLIIIDGKLGLTTIAQNAGQSIRMSASISTVGVGGSVVGTNLGDCITLRCSTSGSSTVWIAESFIGSWTIT